MHCTQIKDNFLLYVWAVKIYITLAFLPGLFFYVYSQDFRGSSSINPDFLYLWTNSQFLSSVYIKAEPLPQSNIHFDLKFEVKIFLKYIDWLNQETSIIQGLLAFKNFKDNTIIYVIQALYVFFHLYVADFLYIISFFF